MYKMIIVSHIKKKPGVHTEEEAGLLYKALKLWPHKHRLSRIP